MTIQKDQVSVEAFIQEPSKGQHPGVPDDWRALYARRDQHWDLTGDYPKPRGLRCPFCATSYLLVRNWSCFKYETGEHTTPYRINVSTKCAGCGNVGAFGLPVSAGVYTRFLKLADKRGGKPPWVS